MGKIRKQWSEEKLLNALQDVRAGKSLSSVSKETGIPKATIFAKVKGTRPVSKRVGPPTILTDEEESEIVRWMFHMSNRGFPITKTQLIISVSHLIKHLNRKTPFKGGKPGRHWYQSFLHRHPEITSRIAQNLTHSRASVSEKALRDWYAEVEKHLTEKQLLNVNASRIFNLDESAFYLSPKGERVLVRKGDKAVYNFTQNDEKECLTVLFTTSASGLLAPPMIVFPYERIPYSVSQSVPKDWSIGKSESGWMTQETFYEYVCNIFEPWLTANNIARPVAVFADGHSSHFTLPLVKFCQEHQIELIALYPNSTHITQPLDIGFFRPFKLTWKNIVTEWRMANQKKLRREDFGPLLKKAIDSIDYEQIMVNAFRKAGLCPFSADALDYNDLLKKQKNDTEPLATTSTENIDDHLNFIEKNIEPSLLREFKEAQKTGVWSGSAENLGLYFFWQKVFILSTGDKNQGENIPTNDQLIEIIVNNENENPDFNDLQHAQIILPNIDENMTVEELNESEFNTSLAFNPGDVFMANFEENANIRVTSSDMNNTDAINRISNSDANGETNAVSNPTVPDRDDPMDDVPDNVPQVFKDIFCWPKTNAKSTKKRQPKFKIPSVATSEQWQKYHEEKEKSKTQQQMEIAERKKLRLEAAENKRKIAEELKAQKVLKKAEQARLKSQKDAIKSKKKRKC